MHQNQAKTSMKTIQNHIKNYWTLQYYDIFWCTRISGVNKRWAIESSTFRKFVEKFWKGGLGERRKKGRGGEKEEERETRGKKKRENREEKKRNCERSRRKPKMIGERYENERRTFPPPFLVTIWNHWNLFGVYQNGNFYGEKNGKWEIL